MIKTFLVVLLAAFLGCAPDVSTRDGEVGTVDSIYRVDRTDYYELIVTCSDGYAWWISDRNVNPGGYGTSNPDTHGTGEFRIREVFDGADRIVGYGGLGYLANAANWIAGGHGYTTEPRAFNIEPYLEPDETSYATELSATFVVEGFDAGNVVVSLAYTVVFDCSTYDEYVQARALQDFELDFEYVAVAVGPGQCLLSGAFDEVNGESGFGCATTTAYSSLNAAQTLTLTGTAHELVVSTDVPVEELDETLVRDQYWEVGGEPYNAIKAYAVRGPRSITRGDIWTVNNVYALTRLTP